MKKILSAGKSFQQGWNNTLASYDERPGMQSAFSYDYWLDTTEVTQKQYYEVTGKAPVTAGSQYGVGDNFPVYYVSWFDAVLYCNARSRAEHLDTVYVYSGIHPPSGGSVYELTGLRYDLSRDGYRLPTEAEWEFAARGGTSALPFSAAADSSYACYYAWFTVNSSGRTHWVATRFPNSLGLYDMAGNVFEWTNDWKCMYNGKSITNSLGALQPGNEYEKVIKGGSYNYSLMYLRPSHRSATYATELSSACAYVGFRCARGPVPNGQYIGVGQQTDTSNPVNIVASANDLLSFIGTSNVKVVFVNVTGNDRTLCYIDFSRTFPAPLEFLDDKNVYLPTISPDGRYVAYCSRDVGLSGPSKITIRSLDSLGTPRVVLAADPTYVPRWWVNPGTGDTCIVYTNSACDDLSPAWSTTKTFTQKVSGGAPVGTPKELITDGSYYGGISVDGHYAVTGFTGLIMKDLWTNSGGRQLFLSPHNGKDLQGSTQVCNVSISPDTVGGVRCLFLDFGCQNQISTVTHCSYGIHEYVFVSTMGDSVVNYVHCPSGEQQWDNPKWSNQPEFAVGCGRNSAGQTHAIYAIDLDKKCYQQIVTGTELEEPCLCLGTILSNDSLGRYNDPPLLQAHETTQMLAFWWHFDSLEILINGTSRSYFGVNPQLITGFKSFNISAIGGDLIWEKHTILNYALNQCPHLKLICSSLDLGLLGISDRDWQWENGFGQSKGYKYDSTHSFWKHGLPADYINKIKQISPPIPYPVDISLYLGNYLGSCNGWGDTPPPNATGLSAWTTNDSLYQRNLATIIMIADTLRSRGIHWIMINFPASPHYKGTDYYSYWGPSWQTARDILQQMRNIEASNQFFHLYDANMDGNHDYGDEDAVDQDHLCGTGADKLTARLNDSIHAILGR